MWKSVVEGGRPQMTVRHTLIARWILKATDTHSEFVVLIAFPQKWLRERSSMLCYSTLLFLL